MEVLKTLIYVILVVIFAVIVAAILIPALPAIGAIIYLGGRMIWCILTGEPFWGEYGPFW